MTILTSLQKSTSLRLETSRFIRLEGLTMPGTVTVINRFKDSFPEKKTLYNAYYVDRNHHYQPIWGLT